MRLSLATKISVALVGMLVLALVSSIVAIVSAYRFESFQETLVADNLSSVRAAEELEIALLEQRGYVSSYILDGGNRSWLDQLSRQRRNFDHWLGQARNTARSDPERQILDELASVHREYARKRDAVVGLYDAGEEEEAKRILLGAVVELYDEAYALCERFIAANQKSVDSTSAGVHRQVEHVTIVVSVTALVTVGLGLALLWLFFRGVIFPLRRIAADARLATGGQRLETGPEQRDEMRELGHYVQVLMTNMAETRSDLAHSRTQLAHAETLAAVGKLAATVAHEIRNPLTAVKMWLYSLRRTVGHGSEALQKLEVVSDEIIRLENIVRQFLEFSRPPQLNLSRHDVCRLVDKTLELVKYRLEEQQVQIVRHDTPELPSVLVDAEQMRQVFLNLINNAVEAMPQGGRIRIAASKSRRGGHEMLTVRIADTGCGMAQEVQQRVFEPFFTTKPEGTGLGLCIAASVMARHGGALSLESSNSEGTQWAVWIPA
jgi:signal transduction histidine kinase